MYIFYIDDTVKSNYTFFDKYKNIVVPEIGAEFDTYTKEDLDNDSAKKYYIFADIDLDTTDSKYFWSYNHIETEATEDGIGSGYNNFKIISEKYKDYLSQNGSIWQICNQLNSTKYLGCNNWYIPSKKELDILISVIYDKKLALNNIKLEKYDYWTSSQRNSAMYAWYYDYDSKKFFASSKENRYKIIPITAI